MDGEGMWPEDRKEMKAGDGHGADDHPGIESAEPARSDDGEVGDDGDISFLTELTELPNCGRGI